MLHDHKSAVRLRGLRSFVRREFIRRAARSSIVVAAALCIAAVKTDNTLLTLVEARAYMLDLINHDRATKGLSPVVLDPVATEAAQRHAEEMVRYRFLAHYNRAGKL